MAYTKYSLTPANNNAAPPDGAPEGMLPSAVNDTMRDMMAQIRDVGDGIRGGTYTMTAPVITGGSITGVALSGNTLTNPVITGGSINNTTVGATTANTGAFTTLSATGNVSFDGGSFVFNETGADKDARFEGDTDANLLFLDASTDRIGIGTSSPDNKLLVNGSLGVLNDSLLFRRTGETTWGMTNFASNLYFNNGSDRMIIDSSGQLLVGLTSAAVGANIQASTSGTSSNIFVRNTNSTAGYFLWGNANGADKLFCAQTGSITNATGTYGTISDAKLKENIVDATPKLDKVMQLQVRNFNFIGDDLNQIGFIAQEIEQVFPSLVEDHIGRDEEGNENGDVTKSVKTSILLPILVKAIQELKATVDAQAARIATLEKK